MLLISFWLHRLTAALLSHTSWTVLILIRPDRASTPITASPAQIPPSSDLYDVMYNGAPSSEKATLFIQGTKVTSGTKQQITSQLSDDKLKDYIIEKEKCTQYTFDSMA
jgi:hypothetical protein